jgi:formylglycine-generating enzyme required for sulfatase activity
MTHQDENISSPRGRSVSIPAAVLLGLAALALLAFLSLDLVYWQPEPTPTVAQSSLPPVKQVASGFSYGYMGKNVVMLLVPAGEFIMGSEEGEADEKPAHRVYVEAFYIDKYEVTNALYAICVEEGVCRAPERIGETYTSSLYYGDPAYDQYPVDNINWLMADTYCQWRGARLPTEAEWEKAARGADGRTYPWGEGIDCTRANYRGCVGHPVEVGSYESGKSIYGVYDMAGNVWEWVGTMHQNYPYVEGFNTQITWFENRVLRGGSWYDPEEFLRAANRTNLHPWLDYNYYIIGFRCALSAE